MNVDTIQLIASEALFTIIKTSAPVLLVSLAVGLMVSIFQTVTSIQEQTLTFVPKFLAIFIGLMVIGHWMLGNMVGLMERLWGDFTLYVK